MATALALHGTRMQLLAAQTGIVTHTIKIVTVRNYGSGNFNIPLPAALPNPPSDSDLAAYLNSNPALSDPFINLDPVVTSQSITVQDYYLPSIRYDESISSFLSEVASFQITDINASSGNVSFAISSCTITSTLDYFFTGMQAGDPVTTTSP